jgi:hypothetical protein
VLCLGCPQIFGTLKTKWSCISGIGDGIDGSLLDLVAQSCRS